jgi:hypothetical protein
VRKEDYVRPHLRRSGRAVTGFTSSSRAWRSEPTSARPCRSTPRPIRTIAS